MKEEGWEIPWVKDSFVVQRVEMKDYDGEHPKMYFVRYGRDPKNKRPFIIAESFFTPEERRKLRLFTGFPELNISTLSGYEVGGRPYCYLLQINPPGIGALNNLRFCDEDGDGKLEKAARLGFGQMVPERPRWAR